MLLENINLIQFAVLFLIIVFLLNKIQINYYDRNIERRSF
jgi:hypothetical protein